MFHHQAGGLILHSPFSKQAGREIQLSLDHDETRLK